MRDSNLSMVMANDNYLTLTVKSTLMMVIYTRFPIEGDGKCDSFPDYEEARTSVSRLKKQ